MKKVTERLTRGCRGEKRKGLEAYRFGFNGMENEDELAEGIKHTQFRKLDSRIGRWMSIDPLASSFPNQSPYSFSFNSPITQTDKTGAAPDDWIEKDGKMMYDNRVTNQEDATDLYGVGAIYRPNGYKYTNSKGDKVELGDYGFFKENGTIFSSPDLAEKSLAYTDPEKARKLAEEEISKINTEYTASIAIAGVITSDGVVPDPSDAAVPKWIIYAVAGAGAAHYLAKRDKEIARIRRKSGGPKGVQYSLRANSSGSYLCYKCKSGTMNLKANQIWKYGETTKPDRYRPSELSRWGVYKVDEYRGNQVQIKVMEKIKIYGYFLVKGHLPPGNKIFR